MTYPCETSCHRGTVQGLEGLPRLQSHHREKSEALFNPAECTSRICLPALQPIHSVAPSFSLFLLSMLFLLLHFHRLCIFTIDILLINIMHQLDYFSSVLETTSLYSSLPFLLLPLGCTFHEDDFSIKCPKHEVRNKILCRKFSENPAYQSSLLIITNKILKYLTHLHIDT